MLTPEHVCVASGRLCGMSVCSGVKNADPRARMCAFCALPWQIGVLRGPAKLPPEHISAIGRVLVEAISVLGHILANGYVLLPPWHLLVQGGR